MSNRQKRKVRVKRLWRKRLSEVCALVEGAQIRDYGWTLTVPLYRDDGRRHALSVTAAFARKRTARDIVFTLTRYAAYRSYKVGVRHE